MTPELFIALILTLILWIVDYSLEGRFFLGKKVVKSRVWFRDRKVFRDKFVAFAAGLSVTYIFLHMFPLVYTAVEILPRLTFLSMLIGFTAYHVIEKWIYKHATRDEAMKELELEHSMTLFFYHFSIGVVLIPLIQTSLVNGFLYFIPVSLHVIINALPHSHKYQRVSVKALFTSAPFLGAVFAILVDIPQVVNVALLGMVVGILLFLEAREVIPKKKGARPFYFLLGVVLYGLLIVSSWFI